MRTFRPHESGSVPIPRRSLGFSRTETVMTEKPPLVPPDAVTEWLSGLRRPVAITGGTGFVGSHLVDTLCEAGVRPRVLVRDPQSPRWIGDRDVEWIPGDLNDQQALGRLVRGAGTVVHLAGLVRAASESDFDRVNRVGTARLVEEVRGSAPDTRLVHVSSLAAVGPSPSAAGMGPEEEPRPVSAYGRSKLGAERAVRALGSDVSWAILRPPAIYGPRDTDIFEFFRMVAAGWLVLPAGERWITIAHAADVVRAALAAASSEVTGQIHHLGEPEPYRLDALGREIALAGGRRVRLVRVPPALVSTLGAGGNLLQRLGLRRVAMTRDKAREILARHWTARTSESLQALGLGECIPFNEGASQTWAWYREEGWLR